LKPGFQKGWIKSRFLSLFIAKDMENLEIGMENRQRDGFFGQFADPWLKLQSYGLISESIFG
jgi:hypothetical protein